MLGTCIPKDGFVYALSADLINCVQLLAIYLHPKQLLYKKLPVQDSTYCQIDKSESTTSHSLSYKMGCGHARLTAIIQYKPVTSLAHNKKMLAYIL